MYPNWSDKNWDVKKLNKKPQKKPTKSIRKSNITIFQTNENGDELLSVPIYSLVGHFDCALVENWNGNK